jgi:hypothetical protein
MINSFLADIYGNLMPGWPVNGSSSDEAIDDPGSLSGYLRGIISVESNGIGLNYANIDKINFFLDRMEDVPGSILPDHEKNYLIGQALFWRAWEYWGKVKVLGGVPLILAPQDVTRPESLFVSRNSTSECIGQIIQDLDNAIEILPDKWTGNNYGRIDAGTAMAFKGRVLLWYASPLFNPGKDQTRWQMAYTANKNAVDFLRNTGKGLHKPFNEIWEKEQNKEVVMVNQFYYPDHPFTQNGIRPEIITQSASNDNQPILSLLNAFPKKDGSPMLFDKDQLLDPTYNAQYLTDFYNNRDDRFYTTIFCGGTKYPSTDDLISGQSFWSVWKKEPDESSSSGFKYVSLIPVQTQRGSNFGISGFFDIKGIDASLNIATVYEAETDWIEIRFAEVLMNYGECANEVNKQEEALQVLFDIRERAGILPGSGSYGITASSQAEIREAYINERFVEFAFEGRRFDDLRRWKRYDILNNQKYRAGLYVTLNDDQIVNEVDDFDWTSSITDETVRQKFHAVYIENLDGDNQFQFNLNLNHWFYPIRQNDLDRNSKLEQNNEWGGTFDPLK